MERCGALESREEQQGEQKVARSGKPWGPGYDPERRRTSPEMRPPDVTCVGCGRGGWETPEGGVNCVNCELPEKECTCQPAGKFGSVKKAAGQEVFEPGERVELVKTTNTYSNLEPGAQGEVGSVDDAGVIHVNWDSGEQVDILPSAGDIIKPVDPTSPGMGGAAMPAPEEEGFAGKLGSDDNFVVIAQEPLTEPTFELSKFLSPAEYQEMQRLVDLRQKTWDEIAKREERNIQEGLPSYANIDYTEVEVLNTKIKQYQDISKGRKGTEALPTPKPEAPAMGMEGKPEIPPAPGEEGLPPRGGPEEGVLTKRPEALPEFAASKYRLIKKAEIIPVYNKKFEATPVYIMPSETGEIEKYEVKRLDTGEIFEIHNPDKKAMNANQLAYEIAKKLGRLRNIMERKAVTCQDFPEVCKNCKSLVVPACYHELTLLDHRDKPYCGASDSAKKIGFRYSFARECLGFDPIVEELKQVVEKPGETIFKKMEDRGEKPILKKEAAYEETPKNEPGEIDTPEEAKARGEKVCTKCMQYFVPRGQHPGKSMTKDWHKLWDVPYSDLVHNPKGTCLPRSIAFQSQPEGGPNQFDDTQNRRTDKK